MKLKDSATENFITPVQKNGTCYLHLCAYWTSLARLIRTEIFTIAIPINLGLAAVVHVLPSGVVCHSAINALVIAYFGSRHQTRHPSLAKYRRTHSHNVLNNTSDCSLKWIT